MAQRLQTATNTWSPQKKYAAIAALVGIPAAYYYQYYYKPAQKQIKEHITQAQREIQYARDDARQAGQHKIDNTVDKAKEMGQVWKDKTVETKDAIKDVYNKPK